MTKEVLLTFIGDTRVPYCTLVNNFEDFYHRSWKIVNLEQNKSFYKNFSKNLLHAYSGYYTVSEETAHLWQQKGLFYS